LHKLGMRKNSCPVTDERIAAGVDAAKKILLESVDENQVGEKPIVPPLPVKTEPAIAKI
jgi:hypothetical protein